MGVLFVLSFSAAILFLGMHRGHCARIPGGQVSIPHSRPYMAALVRGNVFKCGGSLIRENWVLTAAHCQINIGDRVILGAHSLSKYENEKQEFQVARVIHPRNYNSNMLEHDIMLLQLNGRARLNRSVKTVQLPRIYEDVRAGTQCLVLGWGATYRDVVSDVLQEITVSIMDRSVCKTYYHPGLITTNKLCAAPRNKNGGACNGDSGGPLICGKIQTGITSFGEKNYCALPNFPDVYTFLNKDHIQWINNNIQG